MMMVLAGGLLFAQESAEPPPSLLMRVTTHLVLLDVVVTDKNGQPVKDLHQGDFAVEEDGKPQQIAYFSASQAGMPNQRLAAVSPPQLPAGTATNQLDQPGSGPLLILLLDALNTQMVDQARVRSEMLHYLQTQVRPGQPMTVLTLTNRLQLLQTFTTDPRLLLAALEHFHPGQSVALKQEEPTPFSLPRLPNDIAQDLDLALKAFETERVSSAVEARVDITLNAMQEIARAMAGYPGRKNLIWVSSSFPLLWTPEAVAATPTPSISGQGISAAREAQLRQLSVVFRRNFSQQIDETANQLSAARVAVYPVDARGLVGGFTSLASTRGPTDTLGRDALTGPDFANAGNQLLEGLAATQQTMDMLAEDTGGVAYYNRNDIAEATVLSAEHGASYYTIGYYPAEKKWDGKLRHVEVKVTRPGLRTASRRGYFAVEPEKMWLPAAKGGAENLMAALDGPLNATGIVFWGRARPKPNDPMRMQVEFMVSSDGIKFQEQFGGQAHCSLDFLAAAFSAEGKLVKQAGQSAQWTLPAATYAKIKEQKLLPYVMEMELAPGKYDLGLAVRDKTTGLVGTLFMPVDLTDEKGR